MLLIIINNQALLQNDQVSPARKPTLTIFFHIPQSLSSITLLFSLLCCMKIPLPASSSAKAQPTDKSPSPVNTLSLLPTSFAPASVAGFHAHTWAPGLAAPCPIPCVDTHSYKALNEQSQARQHCVLLGRRLGHSSGCRVLPQFTTIHRWGPVSF